MLHVRLFVNSNSLGFTWVITHCKSSFISIFNISIFYIIYVLYMHLKYNIPLLNVCGYHLNVKGIDCRIAHISISELKQNTTNAIPSRMLLSLGIAKLIFLITHSSSNSSFLMKPRRVIHGQCICSDI